MLCFIYNDLLGQFSKLGRIQKEAITETNC